MESFDPSRVTYFAETDYRNKRQRFGIKANDRARHLYVIGKTGMGKSTLLDNMAIQDIRNGEGLAFLDPHGSSADLLLDYIPEERIDDVLYFAPFDADYPISFNILEDVGYDRRHLVVSGLMSVFEKIWEDQWSARMAHILQNTLFALLEYPSATLLDVNRMYIDKKFRKDVVDNITDPTVKSFWTEEFAGYTDRFAAEATPAIQNKIGQFASNPVIRNIIGQPETSFDFRKFMDERKIIVVNLSKGQIGESNAQILGSMLVTKIYLAALSRADVSAQELEKLPHFNLFVDEFQSFANKSFADILSEARKYKLNLHIAHQYVEQMPEEVASAVLGNVGTMITFRVGGSDAEVFEKEFAPQFTAEDLVNLGKFQMYLKLMVDGVSSAPFSATTFPHFDKPELSFREVVIRRSRTKYAEKRETVEESIKQRITAEQQAKNPGKSSYTPKKQNKPKTRQDKEKEFQKAISLDHLKQKPKPKKKKKNPKAASQENISALKAAITQVMGSAPQEQKKEPQQPKKETAPTPQPEPKKEATEQSGPKEVPEHLLRKVLEADGDTKK